MPFVIARVMTAKLATLHELDTVYGVKDLYDLNEIAIVNSYNEIIANRPGKS